MSEVGLKLFMFSDCKRFFYSALCLPNYIIRNFEQTGNSTSRITRVSQIENNLYFSSPMADNDLSIRSASTYIPLSFNL